MNLAFTLEARAPITPIVECVTEHLDGTFTAFFGYESDNAGPVIVAPGPENEFSPAPADRGQTTWFALEGALALRPVLECWTTNVDSTFGGYFGYENGGATPIVVPIGAGNWFDGPLADRGQPTTFAPGRTAVSAAFRVNFTDQELNWHLNDYTVRIAPTDYTYWAPQCPIDPLVIEQPPDFVAGNQSDGWDLWIAEDFVPAANEEITRVIWWGAYVLGAPSTVTDNFKIRFHADDNGQPGSLITEIAAGSVPRICNWTMGPRQACAYTADLPSPMALTQGTRYWISIANQLASGQGVPAPDAWVWMGSSSPQGDYGHYYFNNGSWHSWYSNLAFRLEKSPLQ
jgi:hypothetical protein